MSRLKQNLAAAAVALAGLTAAAGVTQPAEAHGFVTFGIGIPGFGYAAPPPVYYAPPPVYYQQAPAYYGPPAYGPPVVYGAPYAYGRPYYNPYRRAYWGNHWRRW